MKLLTALISGVLFGLGLSIAQMVDPAKVLNFLDVFGTWDPSLAFVMAGGLLVNAIATPLILRRKAPIFGALFRVPLKSEIDKRLILGGVIFGVGWGIAGYCPGPMITSISFVSADILTVLLAYVVGTFVTKQLMLKFDRPLSPAENDKHACVE